jgi:DNA-binding response OmpR family regulator
MKLSGVLKGKRVAIVEDDTLLGKSLDLFFRTRGCAVETLGNAEEASDVGEWSRFDVVISDYLLPGGNGLSVLRRVRETSGGTATILITAYPAAGLMEEARKAGVDGLLYKPFSAEELENALERLFDRDEGAGRSVPPAENINNNKRKRSSLG